MYVQTEVSLYPLRSEDVSGTIQAFCDVLRERGLPVETGNMSSVVSGDLDAVFDGVQSAVAEVGETREIVLVLKLSNACPREPQGESG